MSHYYMSFPHVNNFEMSWVCGGPPGFHPGALVYLKVVQGASGLPPGVAPEPDITPVRLRHPEPLVLDMVSVVVWVYARKF